MWMKYEASPPPQLKCLSKTSALDQNADYYHLLQSGQFRGAEITNTSEFSVFFVHHVYHLHIFKENEDSAKDKR